jgi:hypothetical protein
MIYGLIKSVPQFILLSYIGAEFSVRFIYDSFYKHYMKKPNNSEYPITPNDGFDMHYSPSLPINDSNSNNLYSKCCSYIQKSIDRIYKWDKDFRYTTISMCVYTITFVLLYYLTCIFTFQSIMETSSMSFIRFCLKYILDIGELIYFSLIRSNISFFRNR